MNLRQIIKGILFSLPLVMGCGCATPTLWSNHDLDNHYGPTPAGRIRLFQLENKSDFVVVYEEYSERKDKTQLRAYLLEANRKRIEEQRRPVYISVDQYAGAKEIPVFVTAPENSAESYALYDPQKKRFTIYSQRNEVQLTDELPFYDDKSGLGKKIVLTPVALTADATVLGGILFVAWLRAGAPH